MKKSDIAELITMARAFDDRIEEVQTPYPDPDDPKGERLIEDARLRVWHMLLGDVDVNLAERGLMELYRAPQMMRLQPGHIVEAAERVRRRNIELADTTKMYPPDELAGDTSPGSTSRTAEWMQAAMRAIGRGATVEDAQTYADDELQVTRRMIGPSVHRMAEALERGPRGMQSIGDRMGESA